MAGRRMLTDQDREEISRGIAAGEEQKQIAERIGRDPSVVCREIAGDGGREGYRAGRAAGRARQLRARPKARKPDADPALRQQVSGLLKAGCSPDQAAGRLRFLAGGRHPGTVSAEAIYTWIYALPKGELAAEGIMLRSERTERKPATRRKTPGAQIVGMTSIDDRPADAAGRQIPGHWEGDLVIGKAGKTALASLVERTSRYLEIAALPKGNKDAATTCDSLIGAVQGMPSHLLKSLTWDSHTGSAWGWAWA